MIDGMYYLSPLIETIWKGIGSMVAAPAADGIIPGIGLFFYKRATTAVNGTELFLT